MTQTGPCIVTPVAGRPITHLLFTGVGFKEMYWESEILIDALR
jgi:hypothetical protein